MKFQEFFKKSLGLLTLSLTVLAVGAAAQEGARPTVIANNTNKSLPVAGMNNLYCAGYVQSAPIETSRKIVGAENEQEQNIYGQGNNVYINVGSSSGVQVGDTFSVVRPRGQVETRLTKKTDLGFFVQEVGALEVIRVKQQVAIARVKTSCDNLLLGDLILPVPQRTSPLYVPRPALDVFAEPSGKAKGRIFMARDNLEMLGREQIVYIDLGSEDGVKVGDYLTVYRRLGKGTLYENDEDESIEARIGDYSSSEFKGGKFSNQAPRKKKNTATGSIVTTEEAKEDRPKDLRKIVGEVIILNVKEKTATAMIMRTAQEVHTGDWVELQ